MDGNVERKYYRVIIIISILRSMSKISLQIDYYMRLVHSMSS
jgi:hypothetical protein